MTALRVAAVQHDIVWEDRDATLARVTPLIAEAVEEGARLVVLPELFAVGFTMDTDRVAEPVGGPTSEFLADQAARHGVWVGGSVPEVVSHGGLPRNQFVLAAPDGATYRYAKLHPFTFADEHQHYEAGAATTTVEVDGIRVTPFVCYDLRFADVFWELASTTGLYLVVASWPAARDHHWRTLLAARAIENQAYVLGVNRVGSGGGVDYDGGSCLIGPFGEPVFTAGAAEGVVVGDVDGEEVADVRRRYPFLADRRVTTPR